MKKKNVSPATLGPGRPWENTHRRPREKDCNPRALPQPSCTPSAGGKYLRLRKESAYLAYLKRPLTKHRRTKTSSARVTKRRQTGVFRGPCNHVPPPTHGLRMCYRKLRECVGDGERDCRRNSDYSLEQSMKTPQ